MTPASNSGAAGSGLFDPARYGGVRRPLSKAETLPGHCYTSPEFFQRELDACFQPAWQFCGRLDELPQAGGVMAVDTPAGDVIISRDRDGNVHGFLNACRHRGSRLVTGGHSCQGIVCPYHAWSYHLDGRLRAAPEMRGVDDFDVDRYGLVPVRLAEWGGFLFASFDAGAPDLMVWLGDLPDRMASHQPDNMRCVRRFEFDVAANWKFLIENALEAYHTGTVHAATLGAQASADVATAGQWDALFVHGDPDKSLSTLPGETQVMPFIEGLDDAARSGTWFTVIYPSTQIVFSPDSIWWLDIKPVAVDRSRIVLGACFPQSTIERDDFDRMVQPYFTRWSAATPEDNAIAEAQQRGHSAGPLPPGRFAPREHCVHRLANWVLDRVLNSQQDRKP